jgi:hypothetical protein
MSIVVFGHGWAGRVEAQAGQPTHQELLNQLNALQTAITTLQNTVNGINSTLTAQQTTVNGINQTLTTLQTTVTGITNTLGTLQTAVGKLPTDPRKKYYLTKTTHQGNTALTACAQGFHMASLWEIFDTSNLTYDTTQPDAVTGVDTGAGPPQSSGWIRTGSTQPPADPPIPGLANCNAWTTNDDSSNGTAAEHVSAWDVLGGAVVAPWVGIAGTCSIPDSVWCAQD